MPVLPEKCEAGVVLQVTGDGVLLDMLGWQLR